MYQLALSLWRTCVPFIVAFLGVQAARLGLHLDNATVTSALTTGFGTVYYAVFRYLEHRFGGRWGLLLGAARPPAYSVPASPASVSAPAPVPSPPEGPPGSAEESGAAEEAVDYSKLPEGG